jgi:ribosome-associated protein
VAIADHIQSEMRDHGIRPSSVEGKVDGQWVLMDYRDVVIHIFFESTRDFFDLEGLWRDAPRISPEDVLNTHLPAS